MSAGPFAKFQADSAPPALQHPRWRELLEAWASSKDAAATAAKDAAKCMLVGECPDDALAPRSRALARTLSHRDGRGAPRAHGVGVDGVRTPRHGDRARGRVERAGYGTAKVYSAIDTAPGWWVGSWPPASEGERPARWVARGQ